MIVFVRSYLPQYDGRMLKYIAAIKRLKLDYLCLGWQRNDSFYQNNDDEMLFTKPAMLGGGWKNLFNILRWNLFVFATLFKLRHKICVVHAVDLDCALAGYLFCRLFRKKLIFDIYDQYTAVRNISGIAGKSIDYIERFLAKHADLTLLAAQERFDQLKLPATLKNCLVLENVPLISVTPSRVPDFAGVWKIGYFGVLEPQHRGLEDLIELARNNKIIELHLAGYGGLETLVADQAVKHDNIQFYGAMDSNAGLNLMAQMHIVAGLYYLTIPNHAYAAPNKYYEHLMLGRGLLTSLHTAPGNKVETYATGWAVGEGYLALTDWADRLNISDIYSCANNALKLWNSHYSNYFEENYIQLYGYQLKNMTDC